MKIVKPEIHAIGKMSMNQPIPSRNLEQISPFILLHHHGPFVFQKNNLGLPFGPHPHRGFETLTLIYSGEIEHADNKGYKNVIQSGGVQWMTAGKGIIHSENLSKGMLESGGEMEIIQLWMNLPSSLKMTEPNYQGFQENEIPRINSENIDIQLVSGNLIGKKGIANSITDLTIFNVFGKKEGVFEMEIPNNKAVLFYVLKGKINLNGKEVSGPRIGGF